jgi:Major Facilitator Superfamily
MVDFAAPNTSCVDAIQPCASAPLHQPGLTGPFNSYLLVIDRRAGAAGASPPIAAGPMLSPNQTRASARDSVNVPDSRYSWLRLAICTVISTIGGVGMWSFVVALPAVQADFGIARGEASLPYTLLMIGFALGSIATGRLADRFGIRVTLVFGAIAVGLGYVGAGLSSQLW